MRREALEEPDKLFLGSKPKTATSKYEDAIEQLEQSQFKRVSMSKKDKKAIAAKREKEINEKFEGIDDDNAAIETILRRA